MYLFAEKYQCELSAVWPNVTQHMCRAHVLVLEGISQLLDTCLSGIHNVIYIVNSIVCVVILVRGSRVSAYRIGPMHGPIHILDMHGTVWNAIRPNIQHLECTMQPDWLRINLHATRTNMANTHQPAFVNIIWPDIEECMLVRICVCMLMRICRSLPSHFKGRTYGEGETPCHVIHTRMESVFNGRTGI